jgi:hypothetical protein
VSNFRTHFRSSNRDKIINKSRARCYHIEPDLHSADAKRANPRRSRLNTNSWPTLVWPDPRSDHPRGSIGWAPSRALPQPPPFSQTEPYFALAFNARLSGICFGAGESPHPQWRRPPSESNAFLSRMNDSLRKLFSLATCCALAGHVCCPAYALVCYGAGQHIADQRPSSSRPLLGFWVERREIRRWLSKVCNGQTETLALYAGSSDFGGRLYIFGRST